MAKLCSGNDLIVRCLLVESFPHFLDEGIALQQYPVRFVLHGGGFLAGLEGGGHIGEQGCIESGHAEDGKTWFQ